MLASATDPCLRCDVLLGLEDVHVERVERGPTCLTVTVSTLGVDEHVWRHTPHKTAAKKAAERIVATFASCPIPDVARLGRTLRQ